MYKFNYKILSKYRKPLAKFILNTASDKWMYTSTLGELRKTTKNPSPTNWYCSRELKQRPAGYGAELLPPSHDVSMFYSFIISNMSFVTAQIDDTGAVLQVSDLRFRNIVSVCLFNDAATLLIYLMSAVGRLVIDELDTYSRKLY
jgi:hypothetical protein